MLNDEIMQLIWAKARIVTGYDPNIIRKDSCDAWIMKSEYGNFDNKFGWVIDHVYPKSLGGDDAMLNLRPMQWENNNSKSDDYPTYRVSIQSEGNDNVSIKGQYTVNSDLQNQIKEFYRF